MARNDETRRGLTGGSQQTNSAAGDVATSPTVQEPSDIAQQLRRRRAASLRLPPMPCGHRDPLDCERGHRG